MKRIIRTLLVLAAAVAVGLLARRYVFSVADVTGDSMNDTLMTGDMALVSHLDYALNTPRRGDVAQIEIPGRGGLYIKRVIGLPGETVELVGGAVYINGETLCEDYATLSDDDFYIQLGADEYFVLGDNRPASYDSREEDFGVISAECFRGKIRAILWPADRIDFSID